MFTSTLLHSFSVLVGEVRRGQLGTQKPSLAPNLEGPPPQSVVLGPLLEEPLTRAPCFEALRSPSSTDNRTNDDSGSQNGAQMGPQNGAQKSFGQMSPTKT